VAVRGSNAGAFSFPGNSNIQWLLQRESSAFPKGFHLLTLVNTWTPVPAPPPHGSPIARLCRSGNRADQRAEARAAADRRRAALAARRARLLHVTGNYVVRPALKHEAR